MILYIFSKKLYALFASKVFKRFFNLVIKYNFFMYSMLNYAKFAKQKFFNKNFKKSYLKVLSIYSKSSGFSLVHYIIDEIKSWSFSLRYILNCTLFLNFFVISKFRLKNIFKKVVSDFLIWQEIERMMDSGIISFEKNCIYRSFSYENINSLSYFLFNIFFSEFDYYVFSRVIKAMRQKVLYFLFV